MQPQNDRLSIDEASPIIGVSPSSLRLLVHAGKIRHMRIGPNRGRYFFTREWLDEYLQSCVCDPVDKVQPIVTRLARRQNTREVAMVEQSPKDRAKQFRRELRA